ncbi:MAG: lycopene cyclase family protein, partial [Balneolaceae bacterium]
HLLERYSLEKSDYTISREEKGSIPMEDRHYPAWYNPRVMNIGTVGGLTKPSTGYTFTRIHRHCASIVNALEKGNTPPTSNKSAYRFRVYDMMLLNILKEDPIEGVRIFRELFKKNSFDKILRFLEEDTTFSEELSIFASVPYMPFFKSIYKMKHRIFTGA